MSRQAGGATAMYSDFFVGGEWIKAESSDVVTVACSTTGDPLGSFPVASRTDIDRAVAILRGTL